eukprot:TRINITY_DN96982_c0_g1_i2.p1 TRINITY_DN96982_c0_g1~~TRINITY_DN96982_c0_g1_i2.p1  ORF type:complete len:264 (-),score=54.40 TRINITY_DN96982_c0_g1_i2:287-1078(-)
MPKDTTNFRQEALQNEQQKDITIKGNEDSTKIDIQDPNEQSQQSLKESSQIDSEEEEIVDIVGNIDRNDDLCDDQLNNQQVVENSKNQVDVSNKLNEEVTDEEIVCINEDNTKIHDRNSKNVDVQKQEVTNNVGQNRNDVNIDSDEMEINEQKMDIEHNTETANVIGDEDKNGVVNLDSNIDVQDQQVDKMEIENENERVGNIRRFKSRLKVKQVEFEDIDKLQLLSMLAENADLESKILALKILFGEKILQYIPVEQVVPEL